MGSLFFSRGGGARAMPCYYGLQAIIVSISAFMHRCARATASMSIETKAVRLPRTIFCDPRRRRAGPGLL